MKRLTPEARELAGAHAKLAYHLARKFHRPGGRPLEELQDVAIDSLFRAVAVHDHMKADCVGAWLSWCICRSLRTFIRHRPRHGCRTRFADLFPPAGVDRPDFAPDPACHRTRSPEHEAHVAELLGLLREVLPAEQWDLLWARYVLGKETTEMASQAGCSRGAMWDRLARARQRARSLLPDVSFDVPGTERRSAMAAPRRSAPDRNGGPHRPRPETLARLAPVAEGLRAGLSYRAIALRVGCSTSRVSQLAKIVRVAVG